jgi:hypothetical protein
MKKSILICFLVLVFGIINTTAQIANEIRSYVDSTEILINNGRKMLIQSLIQNDVLKATKIYLYLNEVSSGKSCTAFNYSEELYVRILISDWNGLLTHMQDIKEKRNISACYQFNEKLNDRLYKLVTERLDTIHKEIDLYELSNEQRDLFNLMLYLIKSGQADDEYSLKLKSYKKKYPDSAYNDFLSLYLPDPIYKAGLGITIGPGYVYPQNLLADYFNSNWTFHFSYDFYFGNVYSSLMVSGTSLSLKKSLPAYILAQNPGASIATGDGFSFFDGGLAVGYMPINKKRVRIAPYMMIGGITIESTLYPEDSNLKELTPVNSFYFGPGVHCWLKIADFKANNAFWYGPYYSTASPNAKSTLALQLNVGYNFLTNMYPELRGNVTYLRAGLVWGMGNY